MGNLDEATKRMASAMNQISRLSQQTGWMQSASYIRKKPVFPATPLIIRILSQNHTSNCRKHAEISGNS